MNYRKKIIKTRCEALPSLEELKKTGLPVSWTGNEENDRKAAEYFISSRLDPQSVGFMVDILPYFCKILKEDYPEFKTEKIIKTLDIGTRTGSGANLLGQMFFGVYSRRQMTVDVLDIVNDFEEYLLETNRYINKFIFKDVEEVESKSYDYVVASHVLEHIPDVQKFATNLKRIARKKVIAYTPYNETNPIPEHFIINDEVLKSLNATNIKITDESFFWKRKDELLKTCLFTLEPTEIS